MYIYVLEFIENHLRLFIINSFHMKVRNLSFVLLFICFSLHLSAQWLQTNGPAGGEINCMKKAGNDIWLGTPTGIYRSVNQGISWQKSGFLNGLPVGDIYCSGDTVVVQYAIPGDSASMYYNAADLYTVTSFNGGASWSSPSFIFNDIDFYPNYLGKLYRSQSALYYVINPSATSYFVSFNWGQTWEKPVLPSGLLLNSIRVDPQRLLILAYNSSNATRIFLISNDMGQTWITQSVAGPFSTWAVIDSVVVYTFMLTPPSFNQYGIMRSADLGVSWDTAFLFPTGHANFHFYQRGDTIFAPEYAGMVFLSPDKGLTWQPGSFPPDFFKTSISLQNGDQLFYRDTMIYRYLGNAGISVPSSSGFNGRTIDAVKSCNNKLYCSSGPELFRSADGGQTWINVCRLKSYGLYDPITDIVSSHDTIVAANARTFGRSTDDGLTWDTLPIPQSNFNATLTSLRFKGSRLYLSTNRFWYTDNLGQTWDTLQNLPYIPYYIPCGYLEVHNNQLFTITENHNIYKYDEFAQQWYNCHYSTQGSNSYQPPLLHSIDTFLIMTGDHQFKYSTDGGQTWVSPSNHGLPTHDQFYTYFPLWVESYQGLWLAYTYNGEVYYTNDYGNYWYLMPSGNSDVKAKSLTICNNTLFIGTYFQSVWRRLGSFYNFSGTVYLDGNNNWQKDTGEPGVPWVPIQSQPTGWACSTINTGDYTLFTDAACDTIRPVIPVGYYTVNPPYRISSGADSAQNFGIWPIPGVKDLSIDLTNVNVFQTGFPTLVNLNVLNKGSVVQAPLAKFILPPTLLFQSAAPSPGSISGDTLSWQLGPLNFFESTNIQILVTTTNWTLPGDTIVCDAWVYPVWGDTLPADNYYLLKKEVQGAYDPNDKGCEQGAFFPPIAITQSREMEFIVRFQNTGTMPTSFVRVIDTLSPFLDWSSFRVVASTQPLSWIMHGPGVVQFDFNPLALQPSSINEPASIGFVKYAVKCRPGTQTGAAITNTAYIYFDFNPAIITNTTSTLIADTGVVTSASITLQGGKYKDLFIYPNPACDELNLVLEKYAGEQLSLTIYELSGRDVMHARIAARESRIRVSSLPAGIYLGRILSRDSQWAGYFRFVVGR